MPLFRFPFLARRPTITILRLAGAIGAGPLRAGLSAQALEPAIVRAFAPKRLAAVVLAINSPGGSPVQSALIHDRIRRLADERKVPVIATCEDVAASGGYWLAVAADEILVDANSILGSIGVVSAGFGLHEAIGRLGIERRLHTAGTRKAQLDPFQPEDAEEAARLDALLGEIHENFKAHVRMRRAGKLKAEESALFTGEFWTGRRAVELGLADRVIGLRPYLEERFGKKVRLRDVPAGRASLLRRLRGSSVEALPGAAIAALEERALWARFGL